MDTKTEARRIQDERLRRFDYDWNILLNDSSWRGPQQAMLSQSGERVTAVRLRISGTTDAHGELSRDLEQVRHEAISIATECSKGLFWVERVEVSTSPRLNRDELLKRDDPIGEVVRIIASLQQDPSALASWSAIADINAERCCTV